MLFEACSKGPMKPEAANSVWDDPAPKTPTLANSETVKMCTK